MAYRGKSFLVASTSHLIDEVVDFLTGTNGCGWTKIGPSTDLTSRQAQDDSHGHILGWFLNSDGEDSQQDINMHIGFNAGLEDRQYTPFAYLDGAITDTDGSLTLQPDAVGFSSGDLIRVEDELMLIGGIAGSDLTGLTRGWGLSDPASHSDGVVVQRVEAGYPVFEMFALRDLTEALAVTSSASTLGQDTVALANGLNGWGEDGIGNGRFNWHALVKINEGGHADDGKMRWIYDYRDQDPSAWAELDYQRFKTAPSVGGACNVQIISGGFLPGWSRRSISATEQKREIGTMFHNNTTSGIAGYMYGNKDGIIIIVKAGTFYDFFFYGQPISACSPTTTTTTGAVASGVTTIPVTNTDIFIADQKLRIVSQDASDWVANQDQSAVTRAGATPGDWPDLDPEEIPTEEVVVVSVGASDIVVSPSLNYSYAAGAVIGEDPRPAIRQSCIFNDNGKTKYWLYGAAYTGAPTAQGGLFTSVYMPTDKGSIGSHASHRQFWRAFHRETAAWLYANNSAFPYYAISYNCQMNLRAELYPANTARVMNAGRQNQNDQQIFARLSIVLYRDTTDYDNSFAEQGIFSRLAGWMPFTWYSYDRPPLSAQAEDTVKGQFEGQWEDFRIFDLNREQNATNRWWLVLGPEINP